MFEMLLVWLHTCVCLKSICSATVLLNRPNGMLKLSKTSLVSPELDGLTLCKVTKADRRAI